MSFDIVIRGGTVVDGSGLGSFRADVGVVDGRIASVGKITERASRRSTPRATSSRPASSTGTPTWTPRCSGTRLGTQLVLARRDNRGHGQLRLHPGAGPARRTGPGGPQPRAGRGHLTRGDGRGHRLDLGDVPRVSRRRRRLAQGHQLRRATSATRPCGRGPWANGRSSRQADTRRPGPHGRELRGRPRGRGDRLHHLAQLEHHQTSDDRPVASRLASWEEVVGWWGSWVRRGRHLRRGRWRLLASDPAVRARTLERLKVLAADTGVPLTFGLVATREAGHLLDFLDDVAAAGGRAIGQTHSRGISVLLSFEPRLPFDLIESWRDLRSRPVAEQVHVLRDPELRQPYVDAAVSADYAHYSGFGAEARPPDFEGSGSTGRACRPTPPSPTRAGVATCHPAEAMIDLCADWAVISCSSNPACTPRTKRCSCGHCGTPGR